MEDRKLSSSTPSSRVMLQAPACVSLVRRHGTNTLKWVYTLLRHPTPGFAILISLWKIVCFTQGFRDIIGVIASIGFPNIIRVKIIFLESDVGSRTRSSSILFSDSPRYLARGRHRRDSRVKSCPEQQAFNNTMLLQICQQLARGIRLLCTKRSHLR